MAVLAVAVVTVALTAGLCALTGWLIEQ